MLLSIIIPTRNRHKDLIECINSIYQSEGVNFEYETIIIDDCSEDETKNLQSKTFENRNIKIIHNETQQMMVRSRNIGIENSRGKYLLFVDDDNVIHENMIKHLIDFISKQEQPTIIGPSIAYYNSKERYFTGQKISFFSGKTKYINNDRYEIFATDGIPNVFLVPREIFEKIGNFDEKMVQTFTEPDFYFKALKSIGCKCYIIKNAITYHKVSKNDKFKPRSLGGQYKQKAYFLMRNRTVLIFRYGERYHKIIYLIFFSRGRPCIYSVIILFNRRFDLIVLYRLGFVDGIKYIFDKNSLETNKYLLRGHL